MSDIETEDHSCNSYMDALKCLEFPMHTGMVPAETMTAMALVSIAVSMRRIAMRVDQIQDSITIIEDATNEVIKGGKVEVRT